MHYFYLHRIGEGQWVGRNQAVGQGLPEKSGERRTLRQTVSARERGHGVGSRPRTYPS